MKATVDESLCIGCELCTQVCPEVFTMGVNGFAKAVDEAVPLKHEGACREAAESCPVDAISVTE